MTLFAYLDEFGHIGPYVARQHPSYKESPVFGLAGFVLPAKRCAASGPGSSSASASCSPSRSIVRESTRRYGRRRERAFTRSIT